MVVGKHVQQMHERKHAGTPEVCSRILPLEAQGLPVRPKTRRARPAHAAFIQHVQRFCVQRVACVKALPAECEQCAAFVDELRQEAGVRGGENL